MVGGFFWQKITNIEQVDRSVPSYNSARSPLYKWPLAPHGGVLLLGRFILDLGPVEDLQEIRGFGPHPGGKGTLGT